MGKTCPFSCSIIYWRNFVRVLMCFHWVGETFYQWRLMNMYLLYTGSPSEPKWSHIVKWWWQLGNSFHANAIQYNVVISLGEAQCSINMIFRYCFLNHTSTLKPSRATNTGVSQLSLSYTGALQQWSQSDPKWRIHVYYAKTLVSFQASRQTYTGLTLSPNSTHTSRVCGLPVCFGI